MFFYPSLSHACTSRCKFLKSQIALLHAMSTVLFNVSHRVPAHVLQQRGCSDQQHLLSPRYSFPWPSSKAMLNQLSQDRQRHLFFTKFFVVLLLVLSSDLQHWNCFYCSSCCSRSCCEMGILPVRFLHQGLHEDLETPWSSPWKTRGRKTHTWMNI